MPLVGAGLCENLDAAVADLVVLRRKRILIDANFADGSLGRKLAGCEAVNVKLPAVGPCRRAGQGLEVRLQFVRVVGKSVEFLSGDDDGARVIFRGNIHHGRLCRYRDILL